MNQIQYEGFDIDLVIVIAVYLFSSNIEMGSGIFLFCMGFLTDISSGGILGLFTLTYLLIYMVIRVGSHPIDLLSPGGRLAIIFIAVIFKELLMAAFLTIFSLGSIFDINILSGFIFSGIFTCLLSPFLFYFFKGFEGLLSGYEREI